MCGWTVYRRVLEGSLHRDLYLAPGSITMSEEGRSQSRKCNTEDGGSKGGATSQLWTLTDPREQSHI